MYREKSGPLFVSVVVLGVVIGVILFGYVSFAEDQEDKSLQQVIIVSLSKGKIFFKSE